MKQLMVAMVALLVSAQAAWALELDDAKARGLVGETRSGYLAAVTATPEAQMLVEDINAKRKAEYARIAAQNGQTVDVVEKLAAQKAYQMTPKGQYLQDPAGAWVKK